MTTLTAKPSVRNIPTVPAAFWDYFANVSSDKSQPVVIAQDALGDHLLKLDTIFQLARSVVQSGDMTVNADGQMLIQPVVPTFPEQFGDFEQFVRDFASANNADGITFTRDYCLKHSSHVSDKLRAFTHGYIERYGMPYPGANAVFIGGRYRSTWIGLHNDSCDTFLFPLYGRKRMMIWPPHYFDSMALEKKSALNGICFGHIDLSPYEADAVTYDVAPGEIFFIPAGWWHYNKLEELETTLTLSVGMFSHGTAKDFCDNPIKAAGASSVGSTALGVITRRPGTVIQTLADVQLPEQVQRYIDTIRDNSKIQLLLKLSANSIIRDSSKRGSHSRLRVGQRIAARSDSPLFLLKLGDGGGLLFAAGGMLRVAQFETVSTLIERLQNVPVAVSSHSEEDGQREVVSWLHDQAVLEVID